MEVFIDGRNCYYELEVNSANTLYELFFIWKDAYKRGGKFDVPQFDLHQQQPIRIAFAPVYGTVLIPGMCWAFTNFDMLGIKTAVEIDGTLNDNIDVDNGWIMEIAIP